jgi:Xaa-Pro aminopeptidase
MRLTAAGAAADSRIRRDRAAAFRWSARVDVAADLADLLREFGHEQVDFTIVGSGPNGANPHQEAGQRVGFTSLEGSGSGSTTSSRLPRAEVSV